MNPQENQIEVTPNELQNPLPQQTQQQMPPSAPTPESTPMKIGKFKASRMLVKESWGVLRQDKELLLFPVVSAFTSLIALIVFIGLFFFIVLQGDVKMLDTISENGSEIVGYATLFLYYLLMFFITNYFLAGVYTIVQGRFTGQDLSFNDGIHNVNKHMGKIFVWSLISATIGIILRVISDKSELLGKFIASLFGAAWAILTYFSLPSLIIGQKTIKESFKESASLIRKTWGETIIVNFGIGLFFMILTFIVMAISVGIIFLVPVIEIFILVIALFVLYIIAVSIISSTLNSIITLALYQYALTGTVPQGFTPELIIGTVKGGNKK